MIHIPVKLDSLVPQEHVNCKKKVQIQLEG